MKKDKDKNNGHPIEKNDDNINNKNQITNREKCDERKRRKRKN